MPGVCCEAANEDKGFAATATVPATNCFNNFLLDD
jgi:hypothetical protein